MNFYKLVHGVAVISTLFGCLLEARVKIDKKNKMEDTGSVKPDNFYTFNLPQEILPFVIQYLPENPVVIEAGAYDGKESCLLAKTWPKGTIHSFEPVSELFECVKINTANSPNISIYQKALSDHVGKGYMYLSGYDANLEEVSMSSSLYAPKEHLNYSSVVFSGAEEVETITIDAWAEDNHIHHIDLLWLDMQGIELPVLKASPKILSTVSVILTEVEFVEAYQSQPLYHEIKNWLEAQGFIMVGGNFNFPKNLDQWFGDALFIRKELLSCYE